jgi:hypothetical protein
MQYKTVFVPITGRPPTKYAEALTKQLTELSDDGYEPIAILPLAHENGSTIGMLITARKAGPG